MKITIKNEPAELVFQFAYDEMDAKPSTDLVWFEFDQEISIEPLRIGLVAYALSSEVIGNTFTIENVKIPAHFAAASSAFFIGHELFVEGVSNIAEKITKPKNYKLIINDFGDSYSVIADGKLENLILQRTDLGYSFFNSRGQSVLSCSTNLDIYISLYASNPLLVSLLILFLVAYDALGVTELLIKKDLMTTMADYNLVNFIREVGGDVRLV
ncbi:MAG: hypothetical protein JMN24_08055 [gamma proteobacterium endosymbiont of Lamellibrachia anaximandri]|nr:hypothetical protein [gamma proteobacterium endosymbiont of Lamellibrachia anaximandri]MBL3618531.1 hypothetical protein [gamma proteobacterium endosymbiont of Lamellibrachia anaximandri]